MDNLPARSLSLPPIPTTGGVERLRSERLLLREMELRDRERAHYRNFSNFVQDAWKIVEPGRPLMWNWHLSDICYYLELFRERRIRRLVFNVPFRTMKSTLIMVMYPVWVWTLEPWHQFLTLAHSDPLAIRDAVKSRLIVESPWFRRLWGPDSGAEHKILLSADQNEKKYYSNTTGGFRNAMGIQGGITGKNADTILIDDPHDAEKAQSDVERQNVIDAYDHKVMSRLNDPAKGGIALIMQRLHQTDLTGHLLKSDEERWYHYKIPMRWEKPTGKLLKTTDPRSVPGALMWADRFPEKEVRVFEVRLGSYGTAGQLQQRPAPAGGGILKRKHWQPWPAGQPIPTCVYLFHSYDTAFSEDDLELNSQSACTKWGVFWHEQLQRYCLLLTGAWADWIDYPKLKARAINDFRRESPDGVLIEKKASGQSLIQDMRRGTIPVTTYNPDKDKVSRAYAVQPLFEEGVVFYPEGRPWAEKVIAQCEHFPKGEQDDLVDTVTQAILYVRQSWLVRAPSDDPIHTEPADMSVEEGEDMLEAHRNRSRKRGAYG